jgi:hypothetical protein
MNQWIEIDDQVLSALQSKAEPLVDSPNRVLRRLLGLPPKGNEPQSIASARPGRRGPRQHRVPWGAQIRAESMELPILRSLARQGGTAPRQVVLAAVEDELGDSLTELDRTQVPSGSVRWEIRASEVRQIFRERGWMKTDSPRGRWELTDAGIERLGELEGEEVQGQEKEPPQ